MPADLMTPSGIPAVGPLTWGSHFCHLYATHRDLVETLVPYFQAGLENNERCLWVTCEPLDCEAAQAALRAAIPNLAERRRRGDIEIVDYREWYKRYACALDVLRAWDRQKDEALSEGYRGLRITGNTFFLNAETWDDFATYEATVNTAFKHQPVVAMCSYSLGTCSCENVLDIVRNHDFALARRHGEWEMIENATLKLAKAELLRVNAELDRRVEERTAELNQALRDRELLLRELNHRVKNNLQVISSVLSLQAMESSDPVVRQQLRDAQARISSLALVHALLQQGHGLAALDAASLIDRLATALVAVFDPGHERIAFDVAVPPVPLSSDQAMLLGMLVSELLNNALKHAFPGGRRGTIRITWDTLPNAPAVQRSPASDPRIRLSISDDGVGFDPQRSQPGGLGRMLVGEFASHLAAEMATTSRPGGGTTVQVVFPLESPQTQH
jgi:two-component sensor histidine kinase